MSIQLWSDEPGGREPSARDGPARELDRRIDRFRRERPRNRFVSGSLAVLAAFMAGSWLVGDFAPSEWLAGRRWENLQRFLGELVPYPLRGRPFELGTVWEWFAEVMSERGWEATGITLAISVAAIVLAGFFGVLLSLPAARTFASARPFFEREGSPGGPAAGGETSGKAPRLLWGSITWLTRALLIFVRAIPEYVWAFIFLALLGPNAWPAVLALAVHNTGILGKLNAEVVENLDREPLIALRGLGAGRLQVALAAILPLTLSRFLLFLFYRWETCVREATVLGLLGIVSLGYWIQDARARNLYDEMLLFILLGSALVILGDFLSAAAREAVRRAG